MTKTNKETKHTPYTFTGDYNFDGDWLISNNKGEMIACASNPEDAQFIVKCCNNYEAMKEALTESYSHLCNAEFSQSKWVQALKLKVERTLSQLEKDGE